ncbi:hypothetical protein JMUB7524_27390 [Staphylococcus aureus]
MSRGLGDVYKRQIVFTSVKVFELNPKVSNFTLYFCDKLQLCYMIEVFKYFRGNR